MKKGALALLVASTGCNWVFGINATVTVDAPPDSPDAPDAPPNSSSRLVWGITTTDGAGTPDSELVLAAIGSEALRPAKPTVQIGPELGAGPLMDVDYDIADGRFEIPYTLRELPHRVVYSMPGESLQHEVQWAIGGATLVVPRTTRKDAPAPPAGSGYKVTPTGLIAALPVPVLYASGVFTANEYPEIAQNGAEHTFAFSTLAKPLAGPVGAPQTSQGDWQLLGGWASASQYTVTWEGYALFSTDLVAGTTSTPSPEPAFVKTQRTLTTVACPGADCFPSVPVSSATNRFTTKLAGLAGPINKFRQMYGVSPGLKSPAFLPGTAPDFVGRPVMLPFMRSTNIDATITLADPSSAIQLERVVYAHIGTTRTTNGVGLLSYVQVMATTSQSQVAFSAPIATAVKLGTTDLSGPADSVSHPASSQPIDLTFTPESVPDDYVVTLYEIAGNALSPVRVYHVLTPLVHVDSSLLVNGHTYVFGITSRNGLPGAHVGDYTVVSYPFAETTVFPRTFTIVP